MVDTHLVSLIVLYLRCVVAVDTHRYRLHSSHHLLIGRHLTIPHSVGAVCGARAEKWLLRCRVLLVGHLRILVLRLHGHALHVFSAVVRCPTAGPTAHVGLHLRLWHIRSAHVRHSQMTVACRGCSACLLTWLMSLRLHVGLIVACRLVVHRNLLGDVRIGRALLLIGVASSLLLRSELTRSLHLSGLVGD